MTYNRTWTPKSVTPTTKNQLILAVGRKAFLHLPTSGAVGGDFVPFGRKPGALAGSELVDGQEVEIIAWRPMAPEGLSYQIQRLSDQREWWTRATCLRKSASVALGAE